MNDFIKYGLIAGGLYLAYKWLYVPGGTVTVGAIQQYPAAWDDYWTGQRTGITELQKLAIQKEITKGNLIFT